MATNDITGDSLRSRVNNKAFEDNFDRIFRSGKDDNTSTKDNNDNTDDKAKPSGAGNTD